MRLALHFDSMHEELGSNYAWGANRLVFPELLVDGGRVVSKVVLGDLLFAHVGLKYSEALEQWFRPPCPSICTRAGSQELTDQTTVFAIGFQDIDERAAQALHERIDAKSSSYIGSMEVDTSYPIHQVLWSKLLPKFRVDCRAAYAFWEGYPGVDDKDEPFAEHLRELGFDPVTWEVRV